MRTTHRSDLGVTLLLDGGGKNEMGRHEVLCVDLTSPELRPCVLSCQCLAFWARPLGVVGLLCIQCKCSCWLQQRQDTMHGADQLHNPCRCAQVQEKTVFDDEAEVRRERAAKRATEEAERLKGATPTLTLTLRLTLALAPTRTLTLT